MFPPLCVGNDFFCESGILLKMAMVDSMLMTPSGMVKVVRLLPAVS